MSDLQSLLGVEQLQALRGDYDAEAMVAANVQAVSALVPQFASWNQAVGETFYGPRSPLAPAERERCLVTLLIQQGSPVPLAIHMYWALMEGVEVDELVQIVGLTACYAGMPRLAFGLQTLQRLLLVLAGARPTGGPSAMVSTIVGAFTTFPPAPTASER
jgi:alkylhydroperoxidase/carboxymuconolactone decarboxylase family protein YurZ